MRETMKKRWLLLFSALYFLTGGILTFHFAGRLQEKPVDMVFVNRIIQDTKNGWASGKFVKEPDCPYDYVVLDSQEKVLYQSSPLVPVTLYSAAQKHETIMDVADGDRHLGKVIIHTGYEKEMSAIRRVLITAYPLLLILLFLPLLLYLVYLKRQILDPFMEMKDFARHVAMGNLDFPLPMDKGHIFGAFTESFDIMRQQLKEARMREAKANQSKKELIASLSHDIKTPVASIKLVSELLLATQPDSKTRNKIATIYEKAGQIDHLVTNLFQASLEELEEMAVNVAEESSALIEPIILSADYNEKVHMDPIPGCILLMDSLRLSQVIDNIIHNSYKYAGTAITVTSQLANGELVLEFRDYGKGVPDEELPLLLQKFYRSSIHTSEKSDGSGLGLYISRRLMEQMGGSISCRNNPDGFSAVIGLRLL